MRNYRINNQIRAYKVKLINEGGKDVGIVELGYALKEAQVKGLDLVEVGRNEEIPIVKIMDFGKYLYRKVKAQKKSHKTVLKTVRFGYLTGLHDLQIKARQAEKFLKRRDVVKVELVLRGREKLFKNNARAKIDEFINLLTETIKIDSPIKNTPQGINLIISKK